ncbi:PIN domain-containing protein [Bosea caraganae]|uniref:Ribonuclease VapC n=1 Tax=Bosea caraganae TaxID=2763117 RepID=A0A370L3P9_9HYPH|nr:type II toxin-antitoxin system VapC family toxin [Bosea caraganae]RDJ22970.1 PIN domain-containing protein [Bosea caraganae]RDJ28750.1 PIN domain-containing protein [Bosea caraganae]
MFLDASVLIAAIAEEAEAAEIKLAMFDASELSTTALAIFEASCRLAKLRRISIVQAREAVEEFLDTVGVDSIVIDAALGREAHACADRYHHLTGHPARLNLGDCFAYAAARTSGLKLAYKGNDFLHTDIEAVRFGP